MNYRMISKILGRVMAVEAALMVPPALTAVYYGESPLPFVYTPLIAAALFALLTLPKLRHHDIYAREGFVSVALSWLLMSLVGALPFVFSGEMPNYFDAFFEIVSGFTTTGASVAANVEELTRGSLLWRSLSHWIGGMGVLVFIMAVLPLSEERSMHIMRAEVPGPQVGKLVPRIRHSSAITYLIYVALTVMLVILLCLGGMPFFDSINHAMATAATGGFSIKALSIGYYDSAYIDVVTGVFMLLFGVNFSIYFLLIMRKFRPALRNSELHLYLGIAGFATLAIALDILGDYGNFWHSLRLSFFQVSSIMTTTGFATADFNHWPAFSKGDAGAADVHRRLCGQHGRRHQGLAHTHPLARGQAGAGQAAQPPADGVRAHGRPQPGPHHHPLHAGVLRAVYHDNVPLHAAGLARRLRPGDELHRRDVLHLQRRPRIEPRRPDGELRHVLELLQGPALLRHAGRPPGDLPHADPLPPLHLAQKLTLPAGRDMVSRIEAQPLL